MIQVLRGGRSLASVLLVGLWFAVCSLPLRLIVLPLAWLVPRWRFLLVTIFMKTIVRGIILLLRVGGARFEGHGSIPTGSPVYVVANHQSLLDILQTTLLCHPRVPAFVTRKRYARFVPLVSACIRLLGCPLVDPRSDPSAAVDEIRRGARELPHGVLIFPEGHRSTTGAVRPFRSAGLEAMLEERRLPVYLMVNEGTWRVRRLSDLLFRVHLVEAWSEVQGPLEPPEDPAEIRTFIAGLRERIVARLEALRNQR